MTTMTAALQRAARHFGGQTAMVEEDGRRTSWHDHADRVSRLAGALRALGLAPGERFAVIAANSVSQAELIHAGYWSGCIPFPVNFRLSPPEIASVIAESEARHLFAGADFMGIAEQLRTDGLIDRVLHVGAGEDGSHHLSGSSDPAPPHPAGEDDEALLLFTGGTTGSGKGVPLSHRNIVSNGMQVGLALSAAPEDLMLHVAPMFHSADLLGTAITLAGGAHSYLGAPTLEGFIEALQTRRVSFTMIPPVLLHGLVHTGALDAARLDALRIFISGGAPVPFALLERAQASLPNGSMVQGYGLTETSPILSFMHLQQTRDRTGPAAPACRSVGVPLAGVEMRLIDEDWQDVPGDNPGELSVRGPNVFSGYLNRSEGTNLALKSGWFRTGDVARFDRDGYLHIIDRIKDVIITGGENVYSAEVEAVLAAHPGCGGGRGHWSAGR